MFVFLIVLIAIIAVVMTLLVLVQSGKGGGLAGIAFGQLLTVIMGVIPGAHLDRAYIPVWAIIISIGFSALVGVFFGMFPAVKAARLDPIEALRHE